MSEKEEGLWYSASLLTMGPFGYVGNKSWNAKDRTFYRPSSLYYPSKYLKNTRVGPLELARWSSD